MGVLHPLSPRRVWAMIHCLPLWSGILVIVVVISFKINDVIVIIDVMIDTIGLSAVVYIFPWSGLWRQVACPYCILCFGRCYPGGSSLVDSKTVLEPVRQLVAASVPPPEKANGSPGEEGEEDESKEEEMDGANGERDEDSHQQAEPDLDSQPSQSIDNELFVQGS